MSESVSISEEFPATPVGTPQKSQDSSVGVTIAKNSAWLLVDTLAGMAAAFYCSIVVARRMGPDFMGHYNYILYFTSVLRMLTEVAIPITVRKFAAEFLGRGDYVTLKTVVRAAMRLQVKLMIPGVLGGLIFVFVSFPIEQRGFATLAVLSIVPGLFLSIPSGALWATQKLRYVVISSLVANAVNVAGVTLSLIFHWGLLGLIASLLTSRVVDCVLRFSKFRQQYSGLPGVAGTHVDPELRKRMIRFAGLQLVVTALYALLFDRAEVLFLKALAPSREIAFFSISFTLVQYLLVIPQNFSGAAAASMMVKQGHDPKDAARVAVTTTWFMTLIAAPMLFGVASVADPLLRILYGSKYLPAIPVLTAMSLFGLALAASQPAQYLLVTAERQVFYIVWLVVAGVFDVGGNLLLIPSYGAVGAVYAKGMSQVVGSLGFLVFLVWRFRVRLPVVRMAKLVGIATVMFFAVKAVGRPLPAPLALGIGIPLGAAIFVVLTRLLGCLDAADRVRLRQLNRMFPTSTRRTYLAVVDFLVPGVA